MTHDHAARFLQLAPSLVVGEPMVSIYAAAVPAALLPTRLDHEEA